MAIADLSPILGFQVSGDIGDFTLWTDRYHRVTVIPAAPPLDAPTALQVWQWDRWRHSLDVWNSLAADERACYSRAVRLLNLCCTGPSLWLFCSLKRNLSYWRTIQRQCGLPLSQPPLF